MLTESFLLQSARNHGLTPKQETVFLLKLSQNLSTQEIANQLDISEAACLKRMGEIYDKFAIKGRGRGKEQRLRKILLQQNSQVQTVVAQAVAEPSVGTQPFVSQVSSLQAIAPTSNPLLSPHEVWIQSLHDWFVCLGYQFEAQSDNNDKKLEQPIAYDTHTEWIVKVRARRGWDKIVIHAVRGEAQLPHVRTIHKAVHQHSALEGWVIAPRRISSSARKEVDLPNSNLFCYTFDELIDQEVNFDKYFEWLETTIKEKAIEEKYIQLACKKAEFVPNDQETIYSQYGEQDGWIDGYIDLWLDDPVKEHISVLGEFGTGKTWFTLHYAWQLLKGYKLAKQKGTERPRLPLLIPLRDCAKAATLESLVSEYFFRKYQILLPDYKVFEQLNRMGKLLLIFDGFDEMAAKVDWQSMINNFWQLARVVVPGSKVILTCRTEHFPEAKAGRELLNAELKASTAGLKVDSPQFEVLELEQFSDQQIKQVISSVASPAIAQQFLSHPNLLDIARRPLMLELILDALPAISSGKPVDLSRIYLYTVSAKMEEDISAERTFTSLADKLYFLCELSWEMLSTEQMSLSYKAFPDRIRQFFGAAIAANTDLDHWHYDMMGQTMLIRNERGEYSPAHRSFLEFFVAFKLVSQLGCLAPDFTALAQQQSYVDDTQEPRDYTWSEYFYRKVNRAGRVVAISPLGAFVQEERSQLAKTLGHSVLSKALLDLMLPMMSGSKKAKQTVIQRLLDLLLSMDADFDDASGYLSGNLVNLLLRLSPSSLQGQDLSDRIIRGADFTGASLRDINFTRAHLENCSFSQGWNGDLSVVYSPDGRFLAVVDSTGEISLRSANSSEQVWQKKGHTDWIRALAFDAKSQTLATGSHDQLIKLWDVQTGDPIRTIDTGSRVYSIIFSQQYDLLASSGDSPDIQIWDVRTGECQQTLKGHADWVGAVVFGRDNDGEVLASGSNDGEIKVWDTETGRCIKSIKGSEHTIQALSFDAVSHTLASGSTDNSVKLWNVDTGECIHDFLGHQDWVRTVSLSAKGRWLASGSNDRTIKLWDAQTGKCVKTIDAHQTRVWSVAFSPDHKTLVSGSDDKTIKLWDVQTGQCTKTLWGNSRGVWSIAFSSDARTIYCGSDDHRLQSWNVKTAENLSALSGHKGRVRTISLSESAQLIASGSDDKTIKLWSKQTGDCVKTLKNHSDWVWSVDFSRDGQMLASGSLDNTVMIWDINKRKHANTLTGHTKFVWSVVWSPVAQLLASGSADQTVRLWNPDTGECLQVLAGHRHQIASLAFSPDGERLASVSDDGEIKIWAVKSGRCLATVDDESRLRTVAWSPNGQYLATAGLDKIVKLRNAETGDYIREITTHREPVFSLSFSPDGELLASGGEAGIIHLSEITTSQCLKRLAVDSPYKGLNVSKITGLSASQQATLLSMGAVDGRA